MRTIDQAKAMLDKAGFEVVITDNQLHVNDLIMVHSFDWNNQVMAYRPENNWQVVKPENVSKFIDARL